MVRLSKISVRRILVVVLASSTLRMQKRNISTFGQNFDDLEGILRPFTSLSLQIRKID